MPRDHKQSQTRQRKPREPKLCQICGHVYFYGIEDHPFRRFNDPDFTIAICFNCNKSVTALDKRMDGKATRDHLPLSPFVYILHRVELAFKRHGFSAQSLDIQAIERYVMNSGIPRKGVVRKPYRHDDVNDDQLTLISNIALWAKRAAELTIPTLSPDREKLMSLASDIADNPLLFVEHVQAISAVNDFSALSEQTIQMMMLVGNRESADEIRKSWEEAMTYVATLRIMI
jgi:hypothetical protein